MQASNPANGGSVRRERRSMACDCCSTSQRIWDGCLNAPVRLDSVLFAEMMWAVFKSLFTATVRVVRVASDWHTVCLSPCSSLQPATHHARPPCRPTFFPCQRCFAVGWMCFLVRPDAGDASQPSHPTRHSTQWHLRSDGPFRLVAASGHGHGCGSLQQSGQRLEPQAVLSADATAA